MRGWRSWQAETLQNRKSVVRKREEQRPALPRQGHPNGLVNTTPKTAGQPTPIPTTG